MSDEKRQLAGKIFLEFAILFYTTAKNMYRHENQIRIHSAAFQALIDLSDLPPDRPAMTMSELADDLRITKQQLTKLVNDLEEKQLVERFHDKANRRLVNVSITAEGRTLLEQLKADMLQTTLLAFADLTDGEILELENAFTDIKPLILKMIRTAGTTSFRSPGTVD